MNHSFSTNKPFLLFLLILTAGLFQTGCSRFVTQDAIRMKVAKTPNPHNLKIYYEETEVPAPYKVTGYFEWRRVEPFTHRKNIGRKMLKKTNRYIQRGNLPRPDGVIIDDFLHATYFVFTDENAVIEDEEDLGGISEVPKKSKEYKHSFTPASEAGFPNLRVGGGLGTAIRARRGLPSTARIFARANYRLQSQPYLELVPEIAYHPTRQRITSYFFQLGAHYYLDLIEKKWSTLDIRAYPIGGLNVSWNQGQRRTNNNGEEKNGTLSLGATLGIGGEYRFSEYASAFGEVSALLLANNTNALAIGVGVSSWLH